MPRAARYSLPALRDLRRQLQYAPAETRQRQMEAAEALVAEIDPETTYPDDFVLWRITGYRRDSAASPVTYPGDRLLGDLVTFVQEISDGLQLEPEERAGGAAPVEAAAEALGVSLRTLQRYRRLGLLCHVIGFPDGRRLGCFATSLERFRAREPVRVRSAASFTRVVEADRRAIVAEARELKSQGVESLGRAANMLAKRHGRSPETMRLVLRRHDASAGSPVFRARPAFGARSKRLAERAWRLGVPLSRIATRIGRSEPAVHRHILLWRRDLLAALTLAWIDLPTFARPEAEEVILAAPAASHGLQRLARGDDAVAILESGAGETPDEESVDAMLAAFNLLKCRAAERIAAISGHSAPTAEAIDGVETDLRWAALLKHRLVVLHLPISWRRIEAQGGQPILRRVADEITTLVPLAVRIVAEAVERADPSRGQRLARLVALEMDMALARREGGGRPQRAAVRHGPSGIPIADPLALLCPWQAWLDPPPRWSDRLGQLDDAHRTAVVGRYGLDGTPPLAVPALARALGTTRARAARLAQEGEGRLRWMRE